MGFLVSDKAYHALYKAYPVSYKRLQSDFRWRPAQEGAVGAARQGKALTFSGAGAQL